MILPKQEILEKILKDKMVEDAVDLNQQVQPASIDLTVEKVFAFASKGQVDFDNKERKLSELKELPFDEQNWIDLPAGAYKLVFKEKVAVPSTCAAFTITRTSLARSGCNLQVGFWDPGYVGKGMTLLLVHNPLGIKIKKNAKVAQMIFVKLSKETDSLYAGMHNKENL